MNRYIRPILTLGIGVWLGACAAATGGGPHPDDWSGPVPSDNEWTGTAGLFLAQGVQRENPDERQAAFERALEAAKEGMEEAPENPKIWFMAGQIQARLGNHVVADSLFDRAKEMYPYYEGLEQERENLWANAYNAGVEALQAGDNETALQHMENADAVYEKRPAAKLQLGSLYAQSGETEKAIESYGEALEILQNTAPEDLGMTTEEEKKQWQENEQVAAFNMAQLLATVDRDEEAEQAYRDFLERHPGNITALTNLAVVLSRQEKTEEATKVYNQLLKRDDITAQEYFLAGVGLFQANQYERAEQAFFTSLEMNPYSRDAVYNLAQTLYVHSSDLEDDLDEAGTAADSAAIEKELEPLYTKLHEVTQSVRDVDPFNRNVLALQARAFRGLADIALPEDQATSDEWREKALATLTEHQDMPFDVPQIRTSVQRGGVQLTGRVQNVNLDAGTPVKLRFTFVDDTGSSIATKDVTVTMPEPEQATAFRVSAQTDAEVAGWSYERVQ